MNNKKQRNPEEVLNSLDGLKRATAPDFFYTRLKARMENELSSPAKRPTWIPKPVFAIAGIILIILLNLAVIIRNDRNVEKSPEAETYLSVTGGYSINDVITEEVYR